MDIFVFICSPIHVPNTRVSPSKRSHRDAFLELNTTISRKQRFKTHHLVIIIKMTLSWGPVGQIQGVHHFTVAHEYVCQTPYNY